MAKTIMKSMFNVLKHAQSWNPKFVVVGSSQECADMINQPHEDYPLRVQVTKELIMGSESRPFYWSDAKAIHSYLFRDELNINGIRVGEYRLGEVKVGKYHPPPSIYLDELIKLCFPVDKFEIETTQGLRDWYSLFQSIHPFEDGNGRVGGIIVAILSNYVYKDRYMAPLQ